MSNDIPQLQECPICNQKSLRWDSIYKLYECTNNQCKSVFSEKDLARRLQTADVTRNTSDTESKVEVGKPIWGNMYFDGKSKKWKPVIKASKKQIIQQKVLKPFLIILFSTLIIAFGFFRIATNWLHWFSLPWIEGWGVFTLSFISDENIPWEIIFILIGLFMLYRGLKIVGSFPKGLAFFSFTLGVICLVLWAAVPGNIIDILFWRGPEGERLEAYVSRTIIPLELYSVTIAADGHQVWLHNNPNAEDKSWAEVRQFLWEDKTDEIMYKENSFVCADFAEVVHNNAEKAGIRAGYVCVRLSTGLHALNVFQTKDKGLVYVDCTGIYTGGLNCDKKVNLFSNTQYEPISIFDDEIEWGNMGETKSYWVQW